MAKKARKKRSMAAKKAKRAKAAVKSRTKVKSKARVKAKAKPAARKSTSKPRPKGIAGKVASAFHNVVDTVKETQALRAKLEPPGTSETE